MTKDQMKEACKISNQLREWGFVLQDLENVRKDARLIDVVARIRLDRDAFEEVYNLYKAYVLRRIRQCEEELEKL